MNADWNEIVTISRDAIELSLESIREALEIFISVFPTQRQCARLATDYDAGERRNPCGSDFRRFSDNRRSGKENGASADREGTSTKVTGAAR